MQQDSGLPLARLDRRRHAQVLAPAREEDARTANGGQVRELVDAIVRGVGRRAQDRRWTCAPLLPADRPCASAQQAVSPREHATRLLFVACSGMAREAPGRAATPAAPSRRRALQSRAGAAAYGACGAEQTQRSPSPCRTSRRGARGEQHQLPAVRLAVHARRAPAPERAIESKQIISTKLADMAQQQQRA